MPQTVADARSAVTWFEIPTADFDRAHRFYETIFDAPLPAHAFGPGRIAVFPYQAPGVGGCLDESSSSRPGDAGAVIYLDANGRLDAVLGRVEAAGGQIVVPKTQLSPEIGWIAQILDSEGNRIGLHAMA